MANKLSSAINKSRKAKNNVVASIWLIMALLSGISALALWFFSSAPVFDEKTQDTNEGSQMEGDADLSLIRRIDRLGDLEDAVKPISFDPLVKDLRDYPNEFKDYKFFNRHKGKWTVQVMDVSEHTIITDYLDARKDRAKFAYFRYRDANKNARYLLTYGILDSKETAIAAAEKVNFELPADINVLPEHMDVYLDIIEKYELSPPVKDLAQNRARNIKLQPTQQEIAAKSEVRSLKNKSEDSTEPKSIKESTQTEDTIAVQEQRQVVNSESSNNANPQPAKKTSIQPTVEPTPPPPKPTRPTKPTKPEAELQKERDAIKQLIDEKSQ